MSRFGYSPEQAEQVKVSLDLHLRQVEFRVERLKASVPSAGAIICRLDHSLEEIRAVVGDLQQLVEERADSEVPA